MDRLSTPHFKLGDTITREQFDFFSQHGAIVFRNFLDPQAVATAISLFGFQSGAALATVVGVLIEVPVMLLVVGIVNRSQSWYEAKAN